MNCKTIVTSYKFHKTSKFQLETRPTITAIALRLLLGLSTGRNATGLRVTRTRVAGQKQLPSAPFPNRAIPPSKQGHVEIDKDGFDHGDYEDLGQLGQDEPAPG